jgi:hypothetical protein
MILTIWGYYGFLEQFKKPIKTRCYKTGIDSALSALTTVRRGKPGKSRDFMLATEI